MELLTDIQEEIENLKLHNEVVARSDVDNKVKSIKELQAKFSGDCDQLINEHNALINKEMEELKEYRDIKLGEPQSFYKSKEDKSKELAKVTEIWEDLMKKSKNQSRARLSTKVSLEDTEKLLEDPKNKTEELKKKKSELTEQLEACTLELEKISTELNSAARKKNELEGDIYELEGIFIN